MAMNKTSDKTTASVYSLYDMRKAQAWIALRGYADTTDDIGSHAAKFDEYFGITKDGKKKDSFLRWSGRPFDKKRKLKYIPEHWGKRKKVVLVWLGVDRQELRVKGWAYSNRDRILLTALVGKPDLPAIEKTLDYRAFRLTREQYDDAVRIGGSP